MARRRRLTRLLKEITGKPVQASTPPGCRRSATRRGLTSSLSGKTHRATRPKCQPPSGHAKKQFGGTVIAAELHPSGDTGLRRVPGDAAIDAGVMAREQAARRPVACPIDQAATGAVHPARRSHRPSNGAPGPAPDVPLRREKPERRGGPRRDRATRDIWPVKDVNDKPRNARLHGCRVGEKCAALSDQGRRIERAHRS